jgi:cytoskeletal protein RodZ
MVNWKFWQRKKQVQDPDLPVEVQEYYASTRKSRRGTSWLFGLLALLLTLAIAVALYFAGRFVYNQFFNDEPDAPTTVVETPPTEQPAGTTDTDNGSDQGSGSETPADLPSNEDTQIDEPEAPATSGTSSTSTDSATTLSETPDTGPGDVVAIFVGTVIVASLAYETLARKKQTQR